MIRSSGMRSLQTSQRGFGFTLAVHHFFGRLQMRAFALRTTPFFGSIWSLRVVQEIPARADEDSNVPLGFHAVEESVFTGEDPRSLIEVNQRRILFGRLGRRCFHKPVFGFCHLAFSHVYGIA